MTSLTSFFSLRLPRFFGVMDEQSQPKQLCCKKNDSNQAMLEVIAILGKRGSCSGLSMKRCPRYDTKCVSSSAYLSDNDCIVHWNIFILVSSCCLIPTCFSLPFYRICVIYWSCGIFSMFTNVCSWIVQLQLPTCNSWRLHCLFVRSLDNGLLAKINQHSTLNLRLCTLPFFFFLQAILALGFTGLWGLLKLAAAVNFKC